MNELQAKLTEQQAAGDTETRWESLVGKSYRVEDASVIKPIIKKQVLNQPLTNEEFSALIEKKISGSGLVVGSGTGSATNTLQDQEIVDRFGIRVKTNSPLATKK